MPDLSASFDVSGVVSGAQAAMAALSKYTDTVKGVASTHLKFNDQGDIVGATLRTIQKSGEDVNVVLSKSAAGWKVLSATLADANEQFKKIGISWQGMIRLLEVQVLRRVFATFVSEITSAVGAAATLEQKISEIRTITQSTGISFEQFRQVIARTSADFNRPQLDVAEAAYQGFSNQIIKTAADLGFLNDVARLARISVSSMADSGNALASIMNAYRLSTFEATRVSNELFKAVDLGRFRLRDVADSLGRVAVPAAQLGVTNQEVLAGMTILTRNGIRASEAMTQLNAIFTSLLKPGKELKELIQSWGVDSGQSAISTFGFADVLRRLFDEVDKGGSRLGELEHNVRGIRGVFGLAAGGIAEFVREVEKIRDSGREADNALKIVGESAGEKFKAEINKVKVFFESEFGPKIIQVILNAAEAFGGFQNAVKQVAGVLEGLAKAFGTIFQVIGLVTSALGQLGITVQGVVLTFSAYIIAVKVLGPLLTSLTAGFTAATTAAARFQAVLSLAGSILFLTILATELSKVTDYAKEARAELDRLTVAHRAQQEADNRRLGEQAQAAREQVTAQQRIFLQLFVPVQQAADRLRDRQREAVRNSTNELAETSRTITDQMANIVSHLRRNISTSENEIKESLKRVSAFADKTASDAFNRQLSFLKSGIQRVQVNRLTPAQLQERDEDLVAEQNLREQQIHLLQIRINDLQSQAAQLSRSGNKEDIESARRKFEEIRRLTEEQFNTETAIRRAALQAQAEDFARITGQSQRLTLRVNFNELEGRLASVRAQERAAEEAYQNQQAQSIANNQVILEFERRRQVEITRTQQQLLQFNILNAQGELRQEFRGPEGLQRVREQFDELARAARAALEPVQLTQQEIGNLGARIGQAQTALIQNSLREGTLTAQQIRQLESSLSADRIRYIQQQLQQHTITQQAIRDQERSIAQQRLQIEAQLQREITSRQIQEQRVRVQRIFEEMNRQQQEAFQAIARQREAQRGAGRGIAEEIAKILEETNTLGNLRGGGLPLRAAKDSVVELGQAATEALRAFEANRTQENLRRVEESVVALERAFRNLLSVAGGVSGDVRGPQLEERAQARILPIREQLDALVQATTGLQTANTQLAAVQDQLNRINVLAGAIPQNLQGIELVANRIGPALQNAMNPAAQSLLRVAQSIQELIRQLNALQGVQGGAVGAVPEPIPAQLQPALPQEELAEGGLIGGVFNSRGRDNRLAMVRTGEFIVNPESTQQFYAQLVAMNAGRLPSFAHGGLVGNSTNVGDINISINADRTPDATARAVMSRMNRELRRGNGRL